MDTGEQRRGITTMKRSRIRQYEWLFVYRLLGFFYEFAV